MMKLHKTADMFYHLIEHGTISTADVHHHRRKALVSLVYNMQRLKGYQFEEPERIHWDGTRNWHMIYRLKQNP